VLAILAPNGAAMSELRPYQSAIIAKFQKEVADGRRRILLVAPTGAGKTVIAAAIIAAIVQKLPDERTQQ
jgi:superfamily II DNA or RNA helicase